MLRTGTGPLRGLWGVAYAALIRVGATLLRLASADAVYLRGGFASGEPVYGLSDVDLIAVVGSPAACERLRRRVRRCYEAVPAARPVVEVVVLGGDELEHACVSPFVTHPLDPRTRTPVPQARFYGTRAYREPCGPYIEGSWRLYGPNRAWRHLAGLDPLAASPGSPAAHRWLWAWLELQFVWKHAFRACANPGSDHAAHFCTKMIAEPTRVWLWLADGGRPATTRRRVLEEALRRIPEEEPALRLALSAHAAPARATEAPLGESLAYLCRMTARVAGDLAAASRRAGATPVELSHGQHREDVFPLVDWRARVLADRHDEEFTVADGDPADARLVGALALAAGASPHRALRSGEVLVFPTALGGDPRPGPAALRSVQCPASDPVSFALVEGAPAAEFPELPGWSAAEGAQRAVLEHRAWLEAEADRDPVERRLAMLFSGARAALFAASLDAGEPRLPLTVDATVAALDGAARPVAEAAYEQHEAARSGGSPPSPSVVDAFRRVVAPRLGAPTGGRRRSAAGSRWR
jgi:hypothetical protein